MPKKDEIERTSLIEKKYQRGQSKKDNEIGQYIEYHDSQSNQTVICSEKMFSDRSSLLKEIEKVKKRILNKNEYFLNTLDYSVKVQKNWCSTMYLIKIFLEKPKNNLKKELSNYKGYGLPMQNLTHLFYHLVYSNAILQQNNLSHGNITLESIFVQSQDQYKLSQGLFQGLSPERINMQKILLNEPIYLSPKVYESLKKRMFQYLNHDEVKSDVFSVGLILLEAGLGKSIQKIYFTSQIDETVLESLLKEFENKFINNPLLSSSVRKMLEIKETQRPNFISLKSAIPKYEEVKNFFANKSNGNQKIQKEKSEKKLQQNKSYQKSIQNFDKDKNKTIQSSNKNLRYQNSIPSKYQQTSNKDLKKQMSQQYIQQQQNKKNIYKNYQGQLSSNKLDYFDFFDVYDNNKQISKNSTREEPTKDNSMQYHQKQTIDNFFDVQQKSIPFKSKQNHQINNYQPSKKIPQIYQHGQYKQQHNYLQKSKQRPISQNQYQTHAQPRTNNYRPNSQHQYTYNPNRNYHQQKSKLQNEKNFFDL